MSGGSQANHPNQRTTVADVHSMTLGQCIDWLCWNDANGSYTDAQCDAEGIERLTVETARELVIEAISECVSDETRSNGPHAVQS